jgi:predicted nucleotide-binding protein (sugar kinase/HSP70/actin superfamily)
MKVNITLKNPDAVYESVREAVKDQISSIEGIDEEEREELEESRIEAVNEKLSKWIEYNEYVRLEFDTEAGTARILEV